MSKKKTATLIQNVNIIVISNEPKINTAQLQQITTADTEHRTERGLRTCNPFSPAEPSLPG